MHRATFKYTKPDKVIQWQLLTIFIKIPALHLLIYIHSIFSTNEEQVEMSNQISLYLHNAAAFKTIPQIQKKSRKISLNGSEKGINRQAAQSGYAWS